MSCPQTQAQLTAYLDGELDGDDGTVVRGHLRTCAECRDVAAAEAALRDGLRALPTLDPPAAMWAGVQARLAASEVAESRRPGWRRALERRFGSSGSVWTAMASPRGIAGGLAVAVLAGVLVWRARQPVVGEVASVPSSATHVVIAVPSPTIAPFHAAPRALTVPGGTDVTADLAGEAARTAATYAATAEELITLAGELRGAWSPAEQAAFDDAVQRRRAAVAAAPDDRTRQRELRALIRHVQHVLVNDDAVLASVGAP